MTDLATAGGLHTESTKKPRRLPLWVVLVGLAAMLTISTVIAVGLGPVFIHPLGVLDVIASRLQGRPAAAGTDDFIVWNLRVPRVLQGLIVGAGLAVTGVVVQAVVRNPIADPYTLGLSSGASVGAVWVLTSVGAFAIGSLTLPLAAFAGAALSGLVVFAFARYRGTLVPLRLVLVGIAVSQALGGVTSFLLLRAADLDAQQQVLFWLLGSLAGAQWRFVAITAAIVIPLLGLLLIGSTRLNLLVLGDETAASLGMNTSRARAVFFLISSLLTGTIVAVSGTIGFVGLVIPNLARLVVGADHRRVIPVALLLGALVVVWADTAARLVLAPSELPIGILTAAIGVPFFIAALRRSPSGGLQ